VRIFGYARISHVCSFDLDLYPMTLTHDVDLHVYTGILKMHPHSFKVKARTDDTQTYKTDTQPD